MTDVSMLTVAEFKRFKKALRLLCSMGIDRSQAIEMLLAAMQKRNQYMHEVQSVRKSNAY